MFAVPRLTNRGSLMTSKKLTRSTGLQLPDRQYYSLDQAASYLRRHGASDDIDADYLLHLGATARINLYVVCRSEWHFTTNQMFFGKNYGDMYLDPELRQYVFSPEGLIVLFRRDCLEIEQTGKLTTHVVDSWLFTDNLAVDDERFSAVWLDGDTRKPVCYWLRVNDDSSPPEITAKMLVVTHDELLRLIGGKEPTVLPAAGPVQTSAPHGNAERFAVNRESVFKAAIACKENYPGECSDAEKWAACIDEKAQLFWPETRCPPLESSVIVKLLREVVKLPK